MLERLLRIIFILFFIVGGLALALIFMPERIGNVNLSLKPVRYSAIVLVSAISGFLGILLAPGIVGKIRQSVSWFEYRLQKMPTTDLIGGVVGLIIGLIIANLISMGFQWPWVNGVLKIIGSLLFGYLGLTLGMKKKEDLLSFIPRFSKDKSKNQAKHGSQYKILDTSVIIDGRIADICKSGFIEGTLIIPGFVLEELRHIADSSDVLKRNRGRRGLDILNIIRKELGVMVQIYDKDFDEIIEVDSKLVKLAQVLDGKIITNDFNLNKVAELQGVQVLNINELANAVKPVVLPGEEMIVQVIKDGKEMGQGVAYLDDGTMIVVDGGKKFINQTITVIVTSVLQTAAGRMIFAKPKNGEAKLVEHPGTTRFDEVNAIG